jgi:hypothetical protein
MHDKYRNQYRVARVSPRVRGQIALEAARRLFSALVPKGEEPPPGWLDAASTTDLYLAKRKAAAVLGHRIRPGDLPSDSEVREELVTLWRTAAQGGSTLDELLEPEPESEDPEPQAVVSMAEHLDRFAIYKMRLQPLESVKQNAKFHPEGDALYHSLQVFHLAREVRPYDEEFLLAALLHDIGKAIDPQDHVAAGVDVLRGAVTERTLWLIEHHMDLLAARDRPLNPRWKRELMASENFEDLKLLRDLDDAGRVPGQPVETIDEVMAYLKGLEEESYLE